MAGVVVRGQRGTRRRLQHPPPPVPIPPKYPMTYVEPLMMTPDQYADVITRHQPGLVGERGLLLAILQDAVDCYLRYRDEATPQRIQLYREARAWLVSSERRNILDFEGLCEILGLDPHYLRKGLQLNP